jgi:hypothetical protein
MKMGKKEKKLKTNGESPTLSTRKKTMCNSCKTAE